MSLLGLVVAALLLLVTALLRAAGASLVRTPRADALHDAADGDQKLRIQGGAVEGPGIAGVFNTDAGKAVLGQFSTTKVFVDFNGDYSWTPSSGDVANFFAPDVGALLGAGSGAFAAPQ